MDAKREQCLSVTKPTFLHEADQASWPHIIILSFIPTRVNSVKYMVLYLSNEINNTSQDDLSYVIICIHYSIEK